MLSDKFGVDLSYTVFFSEDFKGSAGNTCSDLELDSSLGLSGQLGFDDQLNEHWAVNAAVWYMDINTTAKFKDNAGNRYKQDAEPDPLVYMAGVSYKF
nr:OmpW family outer membrane protein [Endozoicomonas sp. ISHI1]